MTPPPPERDYPVWIAGLVALTLPAIFWAHWGLAIVGAVCWGWLFWSVKRKGRSGDNK